MLKLTAKTRIPHGVQFIYDPTMDIDIPDDTGAGPVLHTGNCLTVWTVLEDDGQVSLTLTRDESDARGTKVFEGVLDTDGRRLALNDSGLNAILECAVPDARTKLAVYTNHDRDPDQVVCLVPGAR